MVRKSFETYELTPLNGESTVATLNCSSSQMQTNQYYVDKKTEIHVPQMKKVVVISIICKKEIIYLALILNFPKGKNYRDTLKN